MKTLALVPMILALAAASASACGDGPTASNVIATPAMKASLRAAYLHAHPGARAEGPLAWHTYVASHEGGFTYAVATFDGRPRVFKRFARTGWTLQRDTYGVVCAWDVPAEILTSTWWFAHAHGQCWRVP